jgi:ADP-heptose:LPS heptosyltransferase
MIALKQIITFTEIINMKVKFLIIRFSSIGDIVLTTPVIRGLKEQVEDSEIHFLTKPQYSSILEPNPYLTKVHVLKKTLSETLHDLRVEGFDYIIDLHHNLRSLRLKNRLKVMDFSVNKLNKEKWLMVNFKINRLPEKHIVDRYLETVSVFDVSYDNKGLDVFIPEKDKINISTELMKSGYIAFAIGGQHKTKQLPVESIRKMCQHISVPICLLGGTEDMECAKLISENLEHVTDYTGKLNLQQSAEIIRHSRLVITHDTGLMHIAAAFHKPILSVWGNTIPQFGMTPFEAGKDSRIFEVSGLKCRPCSKIGYNKCPKRHFDCMMKQDILEIVKHAVFVFNTQMTQ